VSAASPVTILPATAENAPGLAALIRAAFEEYRGKLDPPSGGLTETPEGLIRDMAKGGALVAWNGSEPAGCVLYCAEPDHLYWYRLAVSPALRRQGIARALVQAVEDLARARGYQQARVSVRLVHAGTRAFYASLGYGFLSLGAHPGSSQPTYATLAKALGGQRLSPS